MVRPQSNTNGSPIGSLANGEIFEVSKTSGDWGFVVAKNGWVSLEYAIYQTSLTGLANIPNGWYRFESILDSKFGIHVEDDSKNAGAKVVAHQANNGDNEIWYLEKIADGSYKIKSKSTGYVLEIGGNDDARRKEGQQGNIWTWEDTYNQHFYIKETKNGLIFVNKLTGMSLDVYGGAGASNNSKLCQWSYNENDKGQLWRLIPVSDSTQTSTPPPAKTELQKAIDRAEEVLNFSWVPVKDFSGYRNRWTYKAGVRYYGLPYGQPTHDKQLLVTNGYTLDFFKQQVADSNSKLYTEKAGNYPGDKCPYYSVDCSVYISYILNAPRFTTSSIITMANSSSNKDYYFTGYDNIKAGDILNVQGHMRWVYAVNGNNVSYYEQRATDSASGATRKNTETKTSLQNAGYRVIRVTKING